MGACCDIETHVVIPMYIVATVVVLDLAIIFRAHVENIVNTTLLKFVLGVTTVGGYQSGAGQKVKFQISGQWDRSALGFDQYRLAIELHPEKLACTQCHALAKRHGNSVVPPLGHIQNVMTCQLVTVLS